MNPIHAAVLGTVQGLTEVLPISSSAHLILIPKFLNWPESGLTFDVALHIGTFLALALYFWRDILELIGNFFSACRGGINTPGQAAPLLHHRRDHTGGAGGKDAGRPDRGDLSQEPDHHRRSCSSSSACCSPSPTPPAPRDGGWTGSP